MAPATSLLRRDSLLDRSPRSLRLPAQRLVELPPSRLWRDDDARIVD